MKKISLTITVLFFLISLGSFGQEMEKEYDKKEMKGSQMYMDCPYHGMGPGMKMGMQMGMHGGMMLKYKILVDKLPEYYEKLGLSEEQTTQLIDIRARYQVKKSEIKAELAKNQMRMEKMLENEASSNDLRDQMRKCSNNRIDMLVAAYDAKKEMMNVLNEDQKQKMMDLWDDHPDDCPMKKSMHNMKMKKGMMDKR